MKRLPKAVSCHGENDGRRHRPSLGVAFAITVIVTAACGTVPSTTTADPQSEASAAAASSRDDAPWFEERTDHAGLDFVHVNGAAGNFFYPEILPPGVALFDYDNDDDLDLFLVQGYPLHRGQTVDANDNTPPRTTPLRGRLYRNDLPLGEPSESLRFTDVTEASRLVADGYGLGVSTGDIDNDGWTDLFVTNFGMDQLFRNNRDGTFTEVSSAWGLQAREEFAVSSAFLDYDRDGWLDLYVGNNVDYALDNDAICLSPAGARDYCPPEMYGGLPDRLYRNRGDGRFDDVSASALRHSGTGAGLRATSGRFGPALGVATADYDGDGWPDIYVANDGTENLLWLNARDGTFNDDALLAGAALSGVGTPEASMGVSAGDFDNDGDADLFMTHLTTEGNNLYVNNGSGSFQDESAPAGLGPGSLAYTGWGTRWLDIDNDGWLDTVAFNGTVIAVEGRIDDPFPYDQPDSVYLNLGNGRFEDVTEQAGPAFAQSAVSRGAAFGDIDNDGDIDIVVGNNGGRARLLINTVGSRHHWLGVRLVNARKPVEAGVGGRDMLGARIAVSRPSGATLWGRVHTDGSYASASDPRVVVGLGSSALISEVQVVWPSGRREAWSDLTPDRYTTLVEGEGRPIRDETL